MKQTIIGWDIGGAHVKAAVVNDCSDVLQVYLEPCPLWQGLEQLQHAVKRIMTQIAFDIEQHAVTMTGELVDLFAHREEGVQQIIATMTQLLPGASMSIFAGYQGFLTASDVTPAHTQAIASANWLATAQFIATLQPHGLLIDIGSTTTDLLLFDTGNVHAIGLTDQQRLVTDELVYTGIVRTAVMAVAQRAFFKGHAQGLMLEYFATMADVYRLTGELQEQHDHTATADGAEKTLPASARRLSRLVGHDFHEHELPLWQQFAQQLRTQQLHGIQRAIARQLSRGILPRPSSFIGAGIGRFLVQELAQLCGYRYVDFDSLVQIPGDTTITAADCAPAVAVALLLVQRNP